MLKRHIILFSFLLTGLVQAQGNLFGVVKNQTEDPLPFSPVQLSNQHNGDLTTTVADQFGRFTLTNLSAGTYEIRINCLYHESLVQKIDIKAGDNTFSFSLKDTATLKPVDIYYDSPYATRNMRLVEGLTITNGMKTHHIDPKKLDVNTARDNARELYAKVPGLNIWESDGGGLQLGIGARGLSPSRTAHFNTRQNGYDISADALGYPETYYTPPSEALEAIQLIRGAASLQFGPQFGGMINFKIKEPSKEKISYEGTHSYGAYQLINTFNSLSGTLFNKRFSYLGYFQHKQGDGWRENSGFNQQNAFLQFKFRFNEHLFISAEQTYMHYVAQQAGGLTDAMFKQDPRQSIRNRNWFEVDWRITAAHFNWEINRTSTLDIKGFKVNAKRLALGNLEKISRVDDGKERQLIDGDFNNIGAELRFLKRYPIGKKMLGISATGVRYYKGDTFSKQGLASADSTADFTFLNPTNLEGSDYVFPSQNISAFFETILRVNRKFSISGGLRFEHITTAAAGSYREQIFHPLTNVIIFDTTYFENKSNTRSILLGGIGFSYRKDKQTEIYGNVAKNYRGINFSDIRIVNPNQIVDPDIQDEKGFNADIGIRGERRSSLFDFSAFFLHYDNKIGVVNQKINEFEFVRVRTNVGRAFSTGIELFAEHRFIKSDSVKNYFTVFSNFSAVYARYGKYEESALSQNWVELVPPISAKLGIKYTHNKWTESILATYVQQHYSDGTNAVSDPNAIAGIIPSYYVIDLSATYTPNPILNLKFGLNNATNNRYFTRRATAYPGPGIIPSDGISFYVSLGLKL